MVITSNYLRKTVICWYLFISKAIKYRFLYSGCSFFSIIGVHKFPNNFRINKRASRKFLELQRNLKSTFLLAVYITFRRQFVVLFGKFSAEIHWILCKIWWTSECRTFFENSCLFIFWIPKTSNLKMVLAIITKSSDDKLLV